MSILGALHSCYCSSNLSLRTWPLTSNLKAVVSGPVGHFSFQSRRSFSNIAKKRKSIAFSDPLKSWETYFITTLACAGYCGTHAFRKAAVCPSSLRNKNLESARYHTVSLSTRSFTTISHPLAQVGVQQESREDLINIVDYYSMPHMSNQPSAPSDVQYLCDPTTIPFYNPNTTFIDDHQAARARIAELVSTRKPPDLDELYELYKSLPEPRLSFLSTKVAHDLLHWFSLVEHKTLATSLRFLSIIDDAKLSNFPLSTHEWTSAISFAGRCYTRVSDVQVEHALNIFRVMEREAGVEANAATFTIIFDIATKAGKFALAERIHTEMTKNRGLEPSRHMRTAIMYHHGLRRDADAVRAAYRDLVDAGDIVDTTVINCVIASLLACGEAQAAEHVFLRSKRLHQAAVEAGPVAPTSTKRKLRPDDLLPPTDWRASKAYGHALTKAATYLAHLPASSPERTAFQARVSLAPNLKTYKVLLYYYAVSVGDLDRVSALMAEMPKYSVELHGSVFLYLFRGFAAHGGIRYTVWTLRRLEWTWEAYCTAVREDRGVFVSRSLILTVLRAYGKCATKPRVWEIWGQAQKLWGSGCVEEDKEEAEVLLGQLCRL